MLAEYDRQHKGPPGGARKIMEDAPAVDAIPVEWLREKMNMADDAGDLDSVDLISWLIQTWQEEQEARNEPKV